MTRCRFRYLPLNQEKGQNFSVVWVRLHQFQAPLGLPPVVIAHLEYSAAAAAKQLHFLCPWFTWDLSPKAILTSAGEELQQPEPATLTRLHYSPCLNSHRGHQRELLLLREKLHAGDLVPGTFNPPLLESFKIKFSSEAHQIIHQGGKLALQPCSNQKWGSMASTVSHALINWFLSCFHYALLELCSLKLMGVFPWTLVCSRSYNKFFHTL